MKDTYLSFQNWEHSGSLPGTTTLIVRKNDAWSYVVLTNTRTPNIINDIRRIMNEIIQ